MISVNPISLTATTQVYAATLTERLCQPYCVNADIQPIVSVVYSVENTNLVGTNMYATIKVQGEVTYVPKSGNACCPKSKIFTEYFTVAFASATASTTIAVAQASGAVSPAFVNCYGVACGISANNVVTITATTPA